MGLQERQVQSRHGKGHHSENYTHHSCLWPAVFSSFCTCYNIQPAPLECKQSISNKVDRVEPVTCIQVCVAHVTNNWVAYASKDSSSDKWYTACGGNCITCRDRRSISKRGWRGLAWVGDREQRPYLPSLYLLPIDISARRRVLFS